MKENPRLAFNLSLIVLIGIPLFFLIVSLVTGRWDFFLLSIAPSMTAGLTGLLLSKRKTKKI